MKIFKRLMMLALPLAVLTGCDEDDDLTGPDFNDIAGEFEASTAEFTISDGSSRDLISEGGTIDLALREDGTFRSVVDYDGASAINEAFIREGTYDLDADDITFDRDPFREIQPLEPLTLKYLRDELGLTLEGSTMYDFNDDGIDDPVTFAGEFSL
ncbi:MAG TPA: hypothetical protein VHG09_05880 [Longimicrobiales bacterium]|nr:hypothetical protein [Longimicrobiales bacterium]